jgi:hypothetical protein
VWIALKLRAKPSNLHPKRHGKAREEENEQCP